MKRLALSVLVLVVSAAAGCRRTSPETPHGHEEGHAENAAEPGPEGEELAVPLDGMRGLRLVEAPPRRSEGAWFPGEATGDENAQVVLASPVGGIVVAPLAAPQRPVAAGTPLVSVASPELADLKARWLTASARRLRAGADLAREERLAAAKATSERELESARNEAAAALADEEAARIGLEARGLSPVSGSPFVLELPLPGPSWGLGDETDVRASDGRRWRARVVGLPAVLSVATRRLSYRLRFLGGPLPIPGKPVEVRVPFASAVILPQNALQQVEGSWGVFVKEDGSAVFRPVKRGTELGGDVMVLDGVEPGETVVTDGAYLLKAALLKRKSGGDAHDH